MKKFLKRLIIVFLLIIVASGAVRFGPYLVARILGRPSIQWVSERFSEALKDKNELVVYEVTLTGQETVSQGAWLIGTVQRVLVPYTFSVRFLVDMSRSEVVVAENAVEVRLPPPRADYGELTVNENEMKKRDWLLPLTPERFAGIQAEMKNKFFDECAENPAYLEAAWENAEKSVAALFSTVVEEFTREAPFEVRVVRGGR